MLPAAQRQEVSFGARRGSGWSAAVVQNVQRPGSGEGRGLIARMYRSEIHSDDQFCGCARTRTCLQCGLAVGSDVVFYFVYFILLVLLVAIGVMSQ